MRECALKHDLCPISEMSSHLVSSAFPCEFLASCDVQHPPGAVEESQETSRFSQLLAAKETDHVDGTFPMRMLPGAEQVT